ncbi:MAG TPA: N-6 DNA methylase [Chroococcales cyanobacterium]
MIASSALQSPEHGFVLGKLLFGFDPNSLREDPEVLIGKMAYLFINQAIVLRILEDAGFCKGLPSAPDQRALALENLSRLLSRDFLPLFEPHLPFEKIFSLEARSGLLAILSSQAFENCQPRFLGDLFERFLDPRERSYLGQFYTSQALVDFILDPLFEDPDATSRRLLDPACGSGHFLHEAYRRFFKAYERDFPGLDKKEIHEKILARNLWGMDLNPLAVQLTRIGLFLLGLEHGCVFSPHLLNTDALFQHEIPASGKGIKAKLHEINELTFSFAGHSRLEVEQFFEEPFDWVVGNPPYGAALSSSDRAYYGENYSTAVGRYDTVSLFIERGTGLLGPGGKLFFVIPHAFSRSGAYQPARELLLEQGRISLMANALSAFEGVNLNTMVIGFEKNKEPGTTRLFEEKKSVFLPIGEVSSDFYRDRPVFPLFLTPDSFGLLQKMEKNASCRLGEIAKIRRGAPISNRDPSLIPFAPGLLPVIRGRDIRKNFCDLRENLFLGVEPGERKPLDDEVPGYQNIASRFRATLFPANSLPLDTTNFLFLQEPRYTRWLIALLNSRAMNYYLVNFLLNRATMTVHLDAPTVGDIPIALPPIEALDEIDRLVDALFWGGKEEDLLEEMVRRAYGLDSKERALFESP